MMHRVMGGRLDTVTIADVLLTRHDVSAHRLQVMLVSRPSCPGPQAVVL